MPAGAKTEIEIKLRVKHPDSIRRLLARIGAQRAARIHEFNVVYDNADRSLFQSGRLLRLRVQVSPGRAQRTRRAILTFKGPPVADASAASDAGIPAAGTGPRYKVRQELEAEVSSPETLEAVFSSLGLLPWFRYEKFRTRYHSRRPGPALHFDLDETPIGLFLELEGSPAAIDRAARQLGYGPGDYITASYYGLYLEDCRQRGVPPGDMLFPRTK